MGHDEVARYTVSWNGRLDIPTESAILPLSYTIEAKAAAISKC